MPSAKVTARVDFSKPKLPATEKKPSTSTSKWPEARTNVPWLPLKSSVMNSSVVPSASLPPVATRIAVLWSTTEPSLPTLMSSFRSSARMSTKGKPTWVAWAAVAARLSQLRADWLANGLLSWNKAKPRSRPVSSKPAALVLGVSSNKLPSWSLSKR